MIDWPLTSKQDTPAILSAFFSLQESGFSRFHGHEAISAETIGRHEPLATLS
jgi:hypothetical protein